jgi:hypothetical protein
LNKCANTSSRKEKQLSSFVQLVSKQCQGNFPAFRLVLCESFGKMRGIITCRYLSLVTFDAALFSGLLARLFSVAADGHSCRYSAHGIEQLGFLPAGH